MILKPTTDNFGSEKLAQDYKVPLTKRTAILLGAVKATNSERIYEELQYLNEMKGKMIGIDKKPIYLKCPKCKKDAGVLLRIKKENNPNGLGEIFKCYGKCVECNHGTRKLVDVMEGGKPVKVSGYWDVTKLIMKVKA